MVLCCVILVHVVLLLNPYLTIRNLDVIWSGQEDDVQHLQYKRPDKTRPLVVFNSVRVDGQPGHTERYQRACVLTHT